PDVAGRRRDRGQAVRPDPGRGAPGRAAGAVTPAAGAVRARAGRLPALPARARQHRAEGVLPGTAHGHHRRGLRQLPGGCATAADGRRVSERPTALVTGAAGNIGTALLRLLPAAGYRTIGLDRPGAPV